jgi:hypothetical protein
MVSTRLRRGRGQLYILAKDAAECSLLRHYRTGDHLSSQSNRRLICLGVIVIDFPILEQDLLLVPAPRKRTHRD